MPPGSSNTPNPLNTGGGKPKPTDRVGSGEYENDSSLTQDPNNQRSNGDPTQPKEAEKVESGKGGQASDKAKNMAASASETAKDVKDVAKAGPTGLESTGKEIKEGADKGGAKGAAGAAAREGAGQAVATGVDVLTAGATTEAHGKIAKGVSKGLKKENLKKIALTFAVIVTIPAIIVGLIIGVLFYAAQDPAKFLSQVLTDPKTREFAVQAASLVPKAIFGSEETLKQYGYVEKRPGTAAVAQSNAPAPKPGSLADKLTKINLKNAVYQTNSAPDCPYRYTTKEMIGPKGDTISVIDKVTTREGVEVSKDKFAVQYCIIQSMPIYNLMVRTDKSREVNEFSNTVLNYGDDPEFLKDASFTEAINTVYKKTYGRITSKEEDAPIINNENVDDYIANVRKALEEGDDPYAVDSNFQFKPGFDTEDKKTVSTMCTFVQGYLTPENLRKGINTRLNTGQRSGVKWNTISSTRELSLMSNTEVGATLREVDNWQASRAYSQNVYGRQTGEAINPESLSNTSYGAGYESALAVLFDTKTQCEEGGTKALEILKRDYETLRQLITNQSNGKFTSPNDFGLQQLMIGLIRMGGGSAVSGLEPGPQNFNNQSQGFRGLSNQYMMRIGGRFLSPNESNVLNAVAENTRREIEDKNGIAYRLFGKDNLRSLANIVKFETPRTPTEYNRVSKQYIAQLTNPVKLIADIHSSVSYYSTGKINQAFAADAIGDAYMRLDTVGLPSEMFEGVDLIQNSDEIQEMLVNGTPEQKKVLGYFEQCAKSNIPSKYYFMRKYQVHNGVDIDLNSQLVVSTDDNPDFFTPFYPVMADKIEKKETLTEEKKAFMACEIYLMPASTIQLNERKEIFGFEDVSGLAKKYHLYLYSNSIADLMVELSNTEENSNIYANPSGGNNTNVTGSTGPVDPGTDTSNIPCPTTPGITDGGVKQDYGPGGVETVKIRVCVVDGITVNVSIASTVKELLDAARADGINFGGGGFRSYDEQVALRKAHCSDWQNSPASSCRPPTAKPGSSMHEVGLAIDFTLNGRTLTRGDAGFNWLSQNASKYGLTNLPSEAWHWSTSGN